MCGEGYNDYDGELSYARRPVRQLQSSSSLSSSSSSLSSSSSSAVGVSVAGIGQAGCLVGRRVARTCHHHHHQARHQRTQLDKRPRGRPRTSSLSGKSPSVMYTCIKTDASCKSLLTFLQIFLDQELIPYHYSSCSCSCSCWGDLFKKSLSLCSISNQFGMY